ncbi:MAG TPA: NAD(P)/FAD-dependent oxidoreductase [Solirubrobacteraceae bacterium]|jgi:flavin-dependent dehydrogenase|nr:NAD(P)/FAD-dependent oxidoreductase [Solirubrobacteraceae bacterium]
MSQVFDVIVVGARCAGSPLAALLARRGLKVALVEQASFPSDTLSTHIFEAQALAFLDRLGVIEEIRATGAPFLDRVDLRQEELAFVTPIHLHSGDVGGTASVRRMLLDPILAQSAAEAGADLQMASKVTGLLEDQGRVAGVRVAQNGSETTLRARLVVGADGRNSTIASLVGARKYNLTPNERFLYWSFFEGVEPGPDPAFVFHRWGNRLVTATHADSGLYQVILIPDLADLPRFREDLEGSFMEYACSCRPVAQALSGARRTGKLFGMLRWEGFFREASGPGWVLVGDAGNFKDPTPGQGIQDAFRQVDALVPAIATALDGSGGDIDSGMAAWGRRRDRDAAEHYWLATDMGKAGPMPAVVPEIERRLLEQGKIGAFLDLFYTHRSRPSQVFTPSRVVGATGRLLARRGCKRRALLSEVGTLLVEDFRRKRLNRQPLYAAAGTALSAGPPR